MRFLIKLLPVFLVGILSLSGCSINPGFNQLDFAKRLSKYKTKAEIEAQLWTVKIGDYEQVAIPVEHEGSMTFYVKDGTEIGFYGWDVTALKNWNRYGRSIDIVRSEIGLNHHLLDGGQLQLECSEYELVSEGYLKEGIIRSARCGSERGLWSYTNAVVVDEAGRAIWMLHHIDPDMPPLEMRLNGVPDSGDLGDVANWLPRF